LALLYQPNNQLQPAVKHYQFCLKADPNNPLAHNNLGVAFLKLGRPDLAEKEFRQAIQLKSDYKEAQANLSALGKNP
jgi:Flp pilus assembly protein TadD